MYAQGKGVKILGDGGIKTILNKLLPQASGLVRRTGLCTLGGVLVFEDR